MTSRQISIFKRKLILIFIVVVCTACAPAQISETTVTPTATPTPLPPQAVDLGTYGMGAAMNVIWSPDGSLLAVQSASGAYVYDTSTWEMISALPTSSLEDDWLGKLTFFPDQQRLFFASGYKAFWQYNLRTKEVSRVYENITQESHEQPFFSPDGTLFVLGTLLCTGEDADRECRQIMELYDSRTGTLIRRIPENGLEAWGDMRTYAFSPDGMLIATGGDDDLVRVWDVASGALQYTLQHESDVKSLSFSPDGSVLVAAGFDAAVRFWDMQTGESLYVLRGTLAEPNQSAAYIEGGKKLLVNYYDGKFKEYTLNERYLPANLLDIKFQTEERLMTEMGRYTPDLIFRINPNGTQMAAVINGNVQIWDLQTGKNIYTLPEFIREVYVIEFSPDENLLAIADHNVHLWQIQPKEFLGTLDVEADQVLDIAFHPDGAQAAFALIGGKTAEVWDLTLRSKVFALAENCPKGDGYYYSPYAAVAYSPEGGKLAFAGACTIQVADAKTGAILETFPNGLGEPADISFSADGKTLIYVSGSGRRAWNLETGKQIYSVKRVDDYQGQVALSPNLFAITRWEAPIRFFDSISGKRLYEFPDGEGGNSIALTRDGRVLALDNYNKISLLDATSGAELTSMKFRLPYTIAFSPGGTYLGARSYYENVHLWDISGVSQYANQIPLQTTTPNVALTPTLQPTATSAPTLDVPVPTAPAAALDSAQMERVTRMEKLGELGMGRVHTMAWSADGKLLAVGGYPGAYIFDAGESQPAQFLPAKNDLLVLQFSPDGQYLAGQISNEAIHVWDVKTGATVHTLKNIGCWNQGMKFSVDSKLLTANCGEITYTWHVQSGYLFGKKKKDLNDGPLSGPYTIRWGMRNASLINVESGEIVKTFEIPGMAPAVVRFSPDGKTLAIWQYQYQIARTGVYYPGKDAKTILQLWNIRPDQPPTLRAEITPGIWLQDMMILGEFRGLAFSSDSRIVATSSGDGQTQIWDVASGRLLYTLPNGDLNFFSPDNKYLATLDNDSARVWDISSGKPTMVWEISGFNRWSYDLAFAKGGTELVSVTDEYFKFFSTTDVKITAPLRQIKLTGIRGRNLAVSADGSRMAYNTTEGILVGENNGDDPNWQTLFTFDEPLTFDNDLVLTFSPDGSRLASDGPDDVKRIWNVASKTAIKLEDPPDVPHPFISEFLFSPDGLWLFGADTQTAEPSTMYLWDTRTGKLARTWTAQFYRFAFHPTQALLAGADYITGIVRFYDLRTGDLVKEIRAGQWIDDLAFSPNGSLLALGYEDRGRGEGMVEIRDAVTLSVLNVIPLDASNLAFSPDGSILAIGVNDGRIEYWGWK